MIGRKAAGALRPSRSCFAAAAIVSPIAVRLEKCGLGDCSWSLDAVNHCCVCCVFSGRTRTYAYDEFLAEGPQDCRPALVGDGEGAGKAYRVGRWVATLQQKTSVACQRNAVGSPKTSGTAQGAE